MSKYLFISPEYSRQLRLNTLLETARQNKITVIGCGNTWEGDEIFIAGSEGAVYGTYAFCEWVAERMNWNLLQNSPDWVTKLEKNFLKRSIQHTRLGDLKRSALDRRQRIDPADDNSFVGGTWFPAHPKVPVETQILLSDEVNWYCRYRYVIMNGKVVTGCCYQLEKTYNTPSIWGTLILKNNINAHQFIKTVVETYECAPACVIDVGFIEDKGWAVVGTHPVWTSEMFGVSSKEFLLSLFAGCQQI